MFIMKTDILWYLWMERDILWYLWMKRDISHDIFVYKKSISGKTIKCAKYVYPTVETESDTPYHIKKKNTPDKNKKNQNSSILRAKDTSSWCSIARSTVKTFPPFKCEALSSTRTADTALLFVLVNTHAVLKWTHHPLSKNVMLRHPAEFSHDSLHLSSVADFLPSSFTSPAWVSHWVLWREASHVRLWVGLHTRHCCSASVFVGAFSRNVPTLHGMHVVSVTEVPAAFVHSPALHILWGMHTSVSSSILLLVGAFGRNRPGLQVVHFVSVVSSPASSAHSPALHVLWAVRGG